MRLDRIVRLAGVAAFCGALGACSGATTTVGGSSAFVDPARYSLYDCKQLATAYADVTKRELELAALKAKAEQGTAGGLMAELGYGPDFVTARAQREQIEAEMSDKRCARVAAPAAASDESSATRRKPAR